jgi:hypothetical protein
MEKKQHCIVRHVAFTDAEDTVVQEMAAQTGMSVCGYIRRQAVYGDVKPMDWEALRQHTEAINYIAQDIKVYTADKSPNPWLFETDLRLINQRLDELMDVENKLIKLISEGK